MFKQLRTCTTSLILTFDFSTGIRRHTFKLPASGPREEGTVVNKSTAHILQLAGEENLVDVETDSSYNNIPQPGSEAATQTFCPLVEQCTTKKLTITWAGTLTFVWQKCRNHLRQFV
jgi:hypothetical protein